jgi:hypothetical protein
MRGVAGIFDKLLHPGLSDVDYTSPELGCGHDGLDQRHGSRKIILFEASFNEYIRLLLSRDLTRYRIKQPSSSFSF